MGLFDNIKHSADELAGKAKEAIGDLTGNDAKQAEGQARAEAANVEQRADEYAEVQQRQERDDKLADASDQADQAWQNTKDAAASRSEHVGDKLGEAGDKLGEAWHNVTKDS